jgi:hypothetical protein
MNLLSQQSHIGLEESLPKKKVNRILAEKMWK